jgi:protein involved in polysaccharide export with SLBB domain
MFLTRLRSIAPGLVCLMLCIAPISLSAQSQLRDPGRGQDPLKPGDVVRLKIWREPDLSGDFVVDEREHVVFAKIGSVAVAGITTDSLKRMLVRNYSAYLRDPAIDVVLLRRVNILGAVRNPGLYQIDMTMTIADAMSMAGGASEDGRPDRAELRRGGERLTVDLSAHTRLAETPLQSGDQLYFPQRSWISRNPAIVAGTLTALTGIVVTILTR